MFVCFCFLFWNFLVMFLICMESKLQPTDFGTNGNIGKWQL